MGKIFMRQGEIWLVNLDPAIGAEIKKIRPALIVNTDACGTLPLKIVAPITGWKEHFKNVPWMVCIEPTAHNNLEKVSSIDCFQLRSVSVTRFIKCIGSVEPAALILVQQAINRVVSVPAR
jgi:mRNA interferase MazF